MKKLIKVLLLIALTAGATVTFSAQLSVADQQRAGGCSMYTSVAALFIASRNPKLSDAYTNFSKEFTKLRDSTNPAPFQNSFAAAVNENQKNLDKASSLKNPQMYELWLSKELDKCADLLVKLGIVK